MLLINMLHYNEGGSETYYFALGQILSKNGHNVIHLPYKIKKYSPNSECFVSNVDFNKISSIGSKVKAMKNMFYSKEAYLKIKLLFDNEKADINCFKNKVRKHCFC